jgi:hypothetical protein
VDISSPAAVQSTRPPAGALTPPVLTTSDAKPGASSVPHGPTLLSIGVASCLRGWGSCNGTAPDATGVWEQFDIVFVSMPSTLVTNRSVGFDTPLETKMSAGNTLPSFGKLLSTMHWWAMQPVELGSARAPLHSVRTAPVNSVENS